MNKVRKIIKDISVVVELNFIWLMGEFGVKKLLLFFSDEEERFYVKERFIVVNEVFVLLVVVVVCLECLIKLC